MIKSTLLLLFVLSFSSTGFSETSREDLPLGQKPPTADQPWKENTLLSVSQAAKEEKPVSPPPVKGVIHVARGSQRYEEYLACIARLKSNNYNAPDADRICDMHYLNALDKNTSLEGSDLLLAGDNPSIVRIDPPHIIEGRKPDILNIDPEREYPILGIRKPFIVNIDPENEYPILGGKKILTRDVTRWNETPIPGAIEVPKFTQTPIPGAIEVPKVKFQALEEDSQVSIFEQVDDQYVISSVPYSLLLNAVELINSVEISAEMEDDLLKISYLTATGTGLYMLSRTAAMAGRLSPIGMILAVITPTAAAAATMDDMYSTPEGFAYFLTLKPEDQAKEVVYSPLLATRVLALAEAIENSQE